MSVTPLRPDDRAVDMNGLVNGEAEQRVLGSLLINNKLYHGIARKIGEASFGNAQHSRTFVAIGSLIEKGHDANPVTLKHIFDPAYLGQLVMAGAAVDGGDYADLVADLAQRRKLLELSYSIRDDALAVSLDRSAALIMREHEEAVAKLRQDTRASEELPPIDPTTLTEIPVPERQWLVPDWVPMGRATALYGAGGEGKTLLAQMLATACAIGAPWLGLPMRRCGSLLLFCEDDADEMHRRQADINRHFGCSFADLGAMRWLPQLGEDNALMTFSEGRPVRTPLFDRLLASAKSQDAKLIITDTLADVFVGNENDRGQARAFVQAALGYLARETQGAIVALAHPSRSGMNSGSGESGSTAWIGTFRSQLYLSTLKAEEGEAVDPDARVLTRRKSNAARRDETIEIRWKDGVFIPVRSPTGIIGTIERRTAERVFVDLLSKLLEQGRHVPHGPRTGNYAPKIFAQQTDRHGFKKADFERAMHTLFEQKKIKIGSYTGPSRHPHECIVLAD